MTLVIFAIFKSLNKHISKINFEYLGYIGLKCVEKKMLVIENKKEKKIGSYMAKFLSYFTIFFALEYIGF